MSNEPESEQHDVSSEHQTVPKDLPGSLTARDILKKLFYCGESVTDDEILKRICGGSSSGSNGRIAAATVDAYLTTPRAKQWVECSWSSFQLLDETDQQLAALEMIAKLNSVIVPRGGRPNGAIGENTAQRIRLAAALQFLGCSRIGMVPFLYPEQHDTETGKQAVYKLLGRHRVWIEREYLDMNETLAIKIVKINVTREIAERIMKSVL